MNWALLMTTALTVSVDSFVCGFTLSAGGRPKFYIIAGITSIVFFLCLIANYAGKYLGGIFPFNPEYAGGIVLALIGLTGIVKPSIKIKREVHSKKRGAMAECVAVGAAIGADGAAADFSLAVMGMNSFIVPVVFASAHFLLILLSICISKAKFINKLFRFEYVPSLILLFFGIYKIVAAAI